MGEHDDRKQRVTEIFGGVMERDAAGELASLLVPLPWGDLARRSDVEHLGEEVEHLREAMATLGSDLRSEMAALGLDIRSKMRSELVGFRGELRNEMADVRREVSDVRREMSDVRKEVGDLRKEVGDLRLEVHDSLAALRGQLPKLITANIASMVGVAALVVGAGAL